MLEDVPIKIYQSKYRKYPPVFLEDRNEPLGGAITDTNKSFSTHNTDKSDTPCYNRVQVCFKKDVYNMYICYITASKYICFVYLSFF